MTTRRRRTDNLPNPQGLRTVVFNNPFDSFHNTVAQAKEEREQLDRLLTISTPRERLLVAVIALSLVILAAWLFLGSVARSLAVDGVLVGPGENLIEDDRTVQALVWVESDVAPQIRTGMPAVVNVAAADGGADKLAGEVSKISAVPWPGRLAPLSSFGPTSVHRVAVALDERLDFASLAGRECRIVIELGRQPPVALLRMRRS